MLEVREEEIDRISELFYRILKGEVPPPLVLPDGYPDNEIRQVIQYVNRFVLEYQGLAGAMSAMSRGDLDMTVPASKMQVLQSVKHLHASLRHLTWKTQQIASGDLSQRVDFMGDFSRAFNSMTQQLQEAFAKIDRQNQELSRANLRMKSDLDAAARVQHTLLPENMPEVPPWKFAWSYRPCDELAGDALNIVRINESTIAFYVLDVSGHGVPAALLSVAAVRSLSPGTGGMASLVSGPGANPVPVAPADVAARLNSLYPMSSNGGHYFTMIYGLLDIHSRRLQLTVAGHPGPILVRENDPPQRMQVSGFPIGMIEDATYDEMNLDLQPRDRLYLHSDGVTEEVNSAGQEFGDDGLLSVIAECGRAGLKDTVEAVVQKVIAWRGEDHLKDDVSVLAIEA